MKVSILAMMLAPLLTMAVGQSADAKIENIERGLDNLKETVINLARQTMLQQFSLEERARTEAYSGVGVIRSRRSGGLKNYEFPSHVGDNVNAIHDHSNYKNTLGMGEVSVNMNGVNFRTRHNDYKLMMPSTSSKEYLAVEETPFPGVPPEVTGTVEEQIDEMKEWFKAYQTQDTSTRDYRQYFIPVLCYLEGTWTLDEEIQEPFSSDRHEIEADSWFQLQERMMFTSYAGSKSNLENLAHLPTTIMSVNSSTGQILYAQWNYRILCKPSPVDVPIRTLKFVDDLAYRMRAGASPEDAAGSRAARFKIYDDERSIGYQLMDEIFFGMPGMDNIPSDDMKEQTLHESEVLDAAPSDSGSVPLKTGYYHRQYQYIKKGALGETVNPRGYNDENLWVAQNTQSRVAPLGLQVCAGAKWNKQLGKRVKTCSYVQNRFSYAMPLELIILTPLLSWNPYDIEIHELLVGRVDEEGSGDFTSSTSDGENGNAKPYNGADLEHYYLTPADFFSKKGSKNRDKADTVKKSVKVKDREGNVRSVVASGTRILLPNIPDIGQVRLRYPITPVSSEGSSVWKELNALKDFVRSMTGTLHIPGETEPKNVIFEMSPSVQDPPGEHTHSISITYQQFKGKLKNGKTVWTTTEYRQGHTHDVKFTYHSDEKKFYYFLCDRADECWDKHPKEIILKTVNKYTDIENI